MPLESRTEHFFTLNSTSDLFYYLDCDCDLAHLKITSTPRLSRLHSPNYNKKRNSTTIPTPQPKLQ